MKSSEKIYTYLLQLVLRLQSGQNPLEDLLQHRLPGLTHRVSDSVGPGWSQRICISDNSGVTAVPLVQGSPLLKILLCFTAKNPCSTLFPLLNSVSCSSRHLLRSLPFFPLVLALCKSQHVLTSSGPGGFCPVPLHEQPRVLLAELRRDNRGQQCFCHHSGPLL